MNFGISGIWTSPGTTIPALLAALAGIATALKWTDPETAARYVGLLAPALIGLVGALYKGRPAAEPTFGPSDGPK